MQKPMLLLPHTIFMLFSLICYSQWDKIAITQITAYTEPYKPPIKNSTILIRNGTFEKIVSDEKIAIPKGYYIINGEGKFATAGFWNSHVHFMESKWMDAGKIERDSLENQLRDMFTSRGFVYVFDLAQIDFENLNILRKRIKDEKLKSPTILAVGIPFTSRSPFYITPLKLPELTTAEDVKNHIQIQIENGANGIKLWSASPTGKTIDYLSPELIQEAARITREQKLPLFAHPTNLKGVDNAVENGVSVLAHVAADDRMIWDSSLVKKMVRQHVALIPTLKLHFWDLRMAGIDPENHSLTITAINQLESFNKAGGTVLFGTDVGYMSDYDIKEELVQMRIAGMSFDQILASLTTNPAQKFNLGNKTGSIEEGKWADLVILREDPALNIENLSTVEKTIHKGTMIFEEE